MQITSYKLTVYGPSDARDELFTADSPTAFGAMSPGDSLRVEVNGVAVSAQVARIVHLFRSQDGSGVTHHTSVFLAAAGAAQPGAGLEAVGAIAPTPIEDAMASTDEFGS
jgi:hypothetical protein